MFAVEKLLEIEMISICPVPTGGTKLTGAYSEHAYSPEKKSNQAK